MCAIDVLANMHAYMHMHTRDELSYNDQLHLHCIIYSNILCNYTTSTKSVTSHKKICYNYRTSKKLITLIHEGSWFID